MRVLRLSYQERCVTELFINPSKQKYKKEYSHILLRSTLD